jgi:two-component system chemotaxis response regulator CheB
MIMARRPTPIVVVSASVNADELNISMNALRAGALAVIEKPDGLAPTSLDLMGHKLCDTLYTMSRVRVIRQHERHQVTLPSSATKVPHLPAPPKRWNTTSLGADAVVGVVASTGGPPALVRLFEVLSPRFSLPILLVQHISRGFLGGFARWLAETTRFHVHIARGGEQPKPGSIYLAPEDHHLRLCGHQLAIDQGPPVCSQRPSGTVLLESLAETLGPQAVGVVLTGMGEDGADGLKRIADAGGRTLAEDASTAVVFGMPNAAAQRGAVADLLPLDDLAAHLRLMAESPGRHEPKQ